MTDAEKSAETPRDEAATPESETAEAALPVTVHDVLRYAIRLFHSQAWQSMGLVPDPATNNIVKDLAQARIAIDCVAFLLMKLEPAAAPAERNELERLLSDLRMNFVEQSTRED
jgi:hypothetical protein